MGSVDGDGKGGRLEFTIGQSYSDLANMFKEGLKGGRAFVDVYFQDPRLPGKIIENVGLVEPFEGFYGTRDKLTRVMVYNGLPKGDFELLLDEINLVGPFSKGLRYTPIESEME